MFVSFSSVIQKKVDQFKEGIETANSLSALDGVIKENYPFLYPHINYHSFKDKTIVFKVSEPLVLHDLNIQKESIKNSLKRNNIKVEEVRFVV